MGKEQNTEISKELLYEVLDKFIVDSYISKNEEYLFYTRYEKPRPQDWKQISIYKLTSMMKKWICGMDQLQGICSHKSYCCSFDIGEFYSGYLFIKTTYGDKVREEIKGKGDTEFDAVKDHCEWILEQRQSDNG